MTSATGEPKLKNVRPDPTEPQRLANRPPHTGLLGLRGALTKRARRLGESERSKLGNCCSANASKCAHATPEHSASARPEPAPQPAPAARAAPPPDLATAHRAGWTRRRPLPPTAAPAPGPAQLQSPRQQRQDAPPSDAAPAHGTCGVPRQPLRQALRMEGMGTGSYDRRPGGREVPLADGALGLGVGVRPRHRC